MFYEQDESLLNRAVEETFHACARLDLQTMTSSATGSEIRHGRYSSSGVVMMLSTKQRIKRFVPSFRKYSDFSPSLFHSPFGIFELRL